MANFFLFRSNSKVVGEPVTLIYLVVKIGFFYIGFINKDGNCIFLDSWENIKYSFTFTLGDTVVKEGYSPTGIEKEKIKDAWSKSSKTKKLIIQSIFFGLYNT